MTDSQVGSGSLDCGCAGPYVAMRRESIVGDVGWASASGNEQATMTANIVRWTINDECGR